ncbi:MAG: hypothetical protein U0325_07445 [Polyangiales bacterium]
MRALSRRSFLAALGALGVGLRAPRAHATTVVPVTVDALTRRSELVVLGTVRATTSRWRERFIVTDCDVVVEAVLKGAAQPGAVVGVRVAGGEVDGIGQRVPDAPIPHAGETAVFFLQGQEDGRWLLAHMTAAVVPVSVGPDGVARVGSATGLRQTAQSVMVPQPVGTFAGAVRAAVSR